MSTHNQCFRAKIRKMYTPVNPNFTVLKWGVMGSSLHGLVFMMHFYIVKLGCTGVRYFHYLYYFFFTLKHTLKVLIRTA